MAVNVYKNGAWSTATPKIYKNGAWVTCSFVKRYVNGEWITIYPTERYLIKGGEFTTTYTVIPLWIDYAGGNLSDNVTKNSAGYINIYSSGYSDMAVVVINEPINLAGYTKLNIEADAQIYLDNGSYANTARVGILSAIPAGLTQGNPSRNVSEVAFTNIFYQYGGNAVAHSTTYYPANACVDISKVNITGYIFVGISSWNYGTEYSNLRIKNLWLS